MFLNQKSLCKAPLSFLVLFFIAIAGCAQKVLTVSKPKGSPVYAFQCMLVTSEGQVVHKTFGTLCDYFDDGEVIAAGQLGVGLLSKEGGLKWKKKINAHHNIHRVNQDHFIVLNSSFAIDEKEWLRFDRISLYDRAGVELKFFDFYENAKALKKMASSFGKNYRSETFKALHSENDFLNVHGSKKFQPTFREFSHANSVYKIPKNKSALIDPAFEEGNFIVNVNGLGIILILDSNLKHILWSKNNISKNIHDVQVLESGEILIYNNSYTSAESAIELLDPFSQSRKLLFKGPIRGKDFHGTSQGSVQILPDSTLLVTEFRKGEVSRFIQTGPNNEIQKIVNVSSQGFEGDVLDGLQEVKLKDLSSFLSNNLNIRKN